MNRLVLALLVLATVLIGASAASAWNPVTYDEGEIFGSVFQNNMDLDRDGSNGRSGHLHVRDSKFFYLDANIDTTLADFDPDADPETTPLNPFAGCEVGDFSLRATGEIALSSFGGGTVLVARFDESHTWCLSTEGAVPAIAVIDPVQSRGAFAGVTGTVELFLPDDEVLNIQWGPIAGYEALGMMPFPGNVFVNGARFEVHTD